ncbi:hypothetical protein ACFWG5_34330 [Streptomyces hydrogenans]|uniref:hypothetical protein n=1 Tax=Streptomyces TaxID=1883 RepID=UPI0036274C64
MTDQPVPQAACPWCKHAAHHPGTECEAGVEHGPKRWHRCLCLNLVGADHACHPQMDCQGGTLGYSDVWHLQRRDAAIDTASDTAQHPAARQATGQDDTAPCVCDTEPEACTAVGEVDPTTADDPIPLRWGLGDVLHGDDDTVIVCLSGPDREPYWLEFDAERAAAFRRDLTPPAAEDTIGLCGHCGVPRENHHHGYTSTADVLAASPYSRTGAEPDPAVGQPAEAHGTDRHTALVDAIDALEGLFIEDENPDERSLGFNAGLDEAITELRKMAELPTVDAVEDER